MAVKLSMVGLPSWFDKPMLGRYEVERMDRLARSGHDVGMNGVDTDLRYCTGQRPGERVMIGFLAG